MLKVMKEGIIEMAYSAVVMAETALGSGSGKEKKDMAIEFIVSRLPVIQPFKMILAVVLSKFIDAAIEQAVVYMKSVQYEQER